MDACGSDDRLSNVDVPDTLPGTSSQPETPMLARITAVALLLLSVVCVPSLGQAKYPDKAVKVVVPSSAGGGTDIVARILADEMARTFGQSFVVENRGGAGGIISIDAVAKAAPDGHTLLITASPITINHLTAKNVPYDVAKDFAPVSLLVALPNILIIHPSVPAKTLAEFIALAKAKPGDLTYGSAGIGTNPHFAFELLKTMAGIDLRHVPYRGYRGGAPALNDTVAGSVQANIANMLVGKPQAEGGNVRALAVTGKNRVEGLPDVPTMAEAGFPAYQASQWYGMFAPAGTPPAIIEQIQREVVRILKLEEVTKRLAADAAEPIASTPAAFATFINEDVARWTAVAKAAGIGPKAD